MQHGHRFSKRFPVMEPCSVEWGYIYSTRSRVCPTSSSCRRPVGRHFFVHSNRTAKHMLHKAGQFEKMTKGQWNYINHILLDQQTTSEETALHEAGQSEKMTKSHCRYIKDSQCGQQTRL